MTRLGIHLYILLFFLSGFSALIYQVCWQRALLSLVGSDIESVTLVVAVFMLGLGIGALAGGRLSRLGARVSVRLFALLEAGTGLFGLVSLAAIGRLAHVSQPTHLHTLGLCFGILIGPTVMMGASLPLLTQHVNARVKNAGETVATLYFANTLGAACAAMATVNFLFGLLGLQKTVWFAALINMGIAAFVLAAGRRAS